MCENRGFDNKTVLRLINVTSNCPFIHEMGKLMKFMPPKGESNRIVDKSFSPIMMTEQKIEIYGLRGFEIETLFDRRVLQYDSNRNRI